MDDKQLNIWIPGDLKVYVKERAKHEKKGQNTIIAELIQEDRARRNGEIIEQASLPMFREILQTELRLAFAQQRTDLRKDQYDIINQVEELFSELLARIGKLSTRAARDGGINRRLLYASLSKAYGLDFAHRAYEDAVEQTNEELIRPKTRERKGE